MKKHCCILLFLTCCINMGLFAQGNAEVTQFPAQRYKPQLHIRFGLGANVDLSRPSDNPAALTLGSRPGVVPALDLRLAHLFARRWGWYADVRFKFFKNRQDFDPMKDDEMMTFVKMALLSGQNVAHLAYSAGAVFRMESDRWQCYPRLGIGSSQYTFNRKSYNDFGGKNIVMDSNGTALCMDFGVSMQYLLCRQLALVFDVLWQQPLTSSKGYLQTEDDEAGAKEFTYRSSTIGRELNISLGVNFCFGLGKH